MLDIRYSLLGPRCAPLEKYEKREASTEERVFSLLRHSSFDVQCSIFVFALPSSLIIDHFIRVALALAANSPWIRFMI